jgi:predicted HTH domain antitoxin
MCQIANMAASSTVSTRLDDQELALIQSLAELEGCDRATLIKSLLRKGMVHLRREQAVRAFRREEVTLSKAAELAGMDQWDFLALMETEKLDLHYDVADFEQDLSHLPIAP